MAQLPLVLVHHGPLQIATLWEWLAIYFHYGLNQPAKLTGFEGFRVMRYCSAPSDMWMEAKNPLAIGQRRGACRENAANQAVAIPVK